MQAVRTAMEATFAIPASFAISRSTSSLDIPGWDSLSHTLFIMALERELNIELPTERIADLRDVGELVDLVRELKR